MSALGSSPRHRPDGLTGMSRARGRVIVMDQSLPGEDTRGMTIRDPAENDWTQESDFDWGGRTTDVPRVLVTRRRG